MLIRAADLMLRLSPASRLAHTSGLWWLDWTTVRLGGDTCSYHILSPSRDDVDNADDRADAIEPPEIRYGHSMDTFLSRRFAVEFYHD